MEKGKRLVYDNKKNYTVQKVITEESGGCLWTVIAKDKDNNLSHRRVILKGMSYESTQQKNWILKEIENHVVLEQYTDITPKIYNVFVEKSEIVVEMQMMPGRPLREILSENISKTKDKHWYHETYNLFVKTCKGVERIHNIIKDSGQPLGFVHKDLKPENIMINDDDAYIIDFGISGPGMSKGIGTPAYMAPEQHLGVNGDDYHVQQATDVYALGQIGIEMFTGKPLEYGEDIIFNNRGDTWFKEKDLKDIGSKTYPSLGAVLKKAIAMRPSYRYQNAGEFVAALQNKRGDKNGR